MSIQQHLNKRKIKRDKTRRERENNMIYNKNICD